MPNCFTVNYMQNHDQDRNHIKPSESVRTEWLNAAPAGFEYSPVPIIGIDSSGLISYCNILALTTFSFDAGSIAGVSFFGLFMAQAPEHTSHELLSRHQHMLDKEFTVEVRGAQKWVLISSANMPFDESKTVTYFFVRDITKNKKRENLFLYLNHAATSLAKTRDNTAALEQIAKFIVPSFANWFTVDMVKDGNLDLVLLKHEDPAKITWAYEYRKKYPPDLSGDSGSAAVLNTGEPGFVPVVTEDMVDRIVTDPVQREEVKKIGLHSVIMAPMWTDNKVTGLVNFISSRPDRHFDEEDLEFALNFASLIALALQNTKLNEEASREIALRKQGEERFRFLLDAIPHKMWTSGQDGRATYYNKQWHDYTGIEGFEDLRAQIWGLIHPEDLAEAAAQWPQAVERAGEMEMEHRLRRLDGDYRWHLSRFTAFKNETGQVTLYVGTSTDIHDQKNYELDLAAANEELSAANEELAAANEEQATTNEEMVQTHEDLERTVHDLETGQRRFQTFLDSIPQIAWASARGGEVEYYNRRWYEYSGLTFEETKNWGWKQVIHPDDLNYNMERLSAIIQTQQAGEFEVREKGADGIFRWHLVRIAPLLNASGDIEQWIGTATDIEELKKVEQQKDDFISIASHELKTPLTSLKTSIQLLYRMKEQPHQEKFQKLIEQANRSIYKLSVLVDDLLNVNRIKERQLPLLKKKFILSELINASCNHIAVSARHEIVVLGDKMLPVYADESAIDQVIVNLVNNAVKYAPDSKQIRITIDEETTCIRLSVQDNGPGIRAEQLPFLFDRYYQAAKQDYRNPGLGLGLYISSEIIRRHGGEIGVTSELGQGSTFWFTLPKAG